MSNRLLDDTECWFQDHSWDSKFHSISGKTVYLVCIGELVTSWLNVYLHLLHGRRGSHKCTRDFPVLKKGDIWVSTNIIYIKTSFLSGQNLILFSRVLMCENQSAVSWGMMDGHRWPASCHRVGATTPRPVSCLSHTLWVTVAKGVLIDLDIKPEFFWFYNRNSTQDRRDWTVELPNPGLKKYPWISVLVKSTSVHFSALLWADSFSGRTCP